MRASLTAERDYNRSRLTQQFGGLPLVFSFDLETNAADEVGHLPIEPDEILVTKKNVDTGGLKKSAGDNSLGEIVIVTNCNEVAAVWNTLRVLDGGRIEITPAKLRPKDGLSRICEGIIRAGQL
jgi:hypothetical protein